MNLRSLTLSLTLTPTLNKPPFPPPHTQAREYMKKVVDMKPNDVDGWVEYGMLCEGDDQKTAYEAYSKVCSFAVSPSLSLSHSICVCLCLSVSLFISLCMCVCC